VTVRERVAKLGALLARVSERAQAPRRANGSGVSAPSDAAALPSEEGSSDAVDELMASAASPAPPLVLDRAVDRVVDVAAVDEPFSPPPAEVEILSEVEVDDEEAPEETPRTPPTPPAASPILSASASASAPAAPRLVPPVSAEPPGVEELPSRERMVAAMPVALPGTRVPPAQTSEHDEETREVERPLTLETGERLAASAAPEVETETEGEDADTEVPPEVAVSAAADEPPASSRRPIALEPKLEELAFGEAVPSEEPHAPPPESGRQVAAVPVELDFDTEFTGVRPKDSEPASAPVEKRSDRASPPPIDADASAPEVTAARHASGTAAVFEGHAPVFKPATFGELLDATLAL
jgi:hypothetical protein